MSSELLAKAREETRDSALTNNQARAQVLTLAQLQSNYAQEVETVLGDLRLPPPATLVDYEVTTNASGATQVKLVYLSEREIEQDAVQLLTGDVRSRFENPDASVVFERLEITSAPLSFGRNQTQIDTKHTEVIDRVAQQLQRFGSLRVEIATGADGNEREGVARSANAR